MFEAEDDDLKKAARLMFFTNPFIKITKYINDPSEIYRKCRAHGHYTV